MRQLFPEPLDEVDLAAAYGSPPAVRVNMIASLDGASAVSGLSGGLGGPADKVVFAAIRGQADAILVGAGTMRAEGYGPSRVGPIAVVTRSCRLDWSSRFFTQAVHRPIVVTVASAGAGEQNRAAEVADVLLAGQSDVDVADAIRQLHGRGFRHLLVEGGPSLNGDVAATGLVDELCLTVSPTLVGGDARRIVSGAGPLEPLPMEPVHMLEQDGYLFLRYRLRHHLPRPPSS